MSSSRRLSVLTVFVLLMTVVTATTAYSGAKTPAASESATTLGLQTEMPLPTVQTDSPTPEPQTAEPAPAPTPSPTLNPTLSPTRRIRQKPTVTPGPEPKYAGAKLQSKPTSGKFSIGVAPTVVGPLRKYFIPDSSAQKKLRELFQNTDKDNGIFDKNSVYTGLTLVDEEGRENYLHSGSNELLKYIQSLTRNNCGITQLNPAEINGLVSAQISYSRNGVKRAQVITDPIDLKYLEDRLSKAAAMNYGTSCDFYESILTLRHKDGAEILLRLATDGCEVYFHDGMYYNYQMDPNEPLEGIQGKDILGLFDEIPWAINEN